MFKYFLLLNLRIVFKFSFQIFAEDTILVTHNSECIGYICVTW